METDELLGLIADGFRAVAGRPPGDLELGTDVLDLGLDSLQILELVVWLEDTLHVDVTHDQLAAVRTVDDLIHTLRPSRPAQ
jgi:acyl carrier protein